MASRTEVLDATRDRARETRLALAHAAAALRPARPTPSAEHIRELTARVVGALFAAEIDDPQVVVKALDVALAGLAELREAGPSFGMDGAALDRMAGDLALPRRELARALSAPDLTVRVDAHSEHNFFSGFSGDIAEGGLFAATYEVLPEGAILRLGIELPGSTRIDTRAVVAWVRRAGQAGSEKPGMGLTLLDLDAHDRQAIGAFMAHREPLFHEP